MWCADEHRTKEVAKVNSPLTAPSIDDPARPIASAADDACNWHVSVAMVRRCCDSPEIGSRGEQGLQYSDGVAVTLSRLLLTRFLWLSSSSVKDKASSFETEAGSLKLAPRVSADGLTPRSFFLFFSAEARKQLPPMTFRRLSLPRA